MFVVDESKLVDLLYRIDIANHSYEIARTSLAEHGQANECMSGMPRHCKAMKDVVSCDKPGGVAHTP